MTELERLATTLLTQWHGEGGADGGPITVSALLDRVLPYRLARRLLGIDVSEDYEALLLRLLAEEEGLVQVLPLEAAELARSTISSKLPDLDVLQLLRSAEVTVTPATVARLEGVLQMPPTRMPEAAPAPLPAAVAPPEPLPEFLTAVPITPPAVLCWSCSEALPEGRSVNFCPFCGADQRQPACAACGGAVEHHWKHCPECGLKLGG